MTFCERPLADAREVIVVQLRLLDMMVRRERDPVSMDVATRAALIDLMARVVVAVFHGEVGANDRHTMQSQDQTGGTWIAKRLCIFGQSSERQVIYNKESPNTPVCDGRTGARSGLETG